jgi:hypothetical protein
MAQMGTDPPNDENPTLPNFSIWRDPAPKNSEDDLRTNEKRTGLQDWI